MKKILTIPQLSAHLQNLKIDGSATPRNQLLNSQAISCVDGRNLRGVIAAPGGNAGLFLQLLATIEGHTGNTLSRTQISTLFTRYLEWFGQFYMHTDSHALEGLMQSLNKRGILFSNLDELILYLKHPHESQRPLLLNLLAEEAFTGCGHIRLMLENPEPYRLRKELVTIFIEAFWTHFWNRDEHLQFEVLEGAHAEQAVINIHVPDREENDKTPCPLLAPQLEGIQVFVNHPEAIAYMHRQHADFLIAQSYPGIEDYEAFIQLHRVIHNAQIRATVQALGAGLPVFDVVLDEELNVLQITQDE